jgi:hypothetical protein
MPLGLCHGEKPLAGRVLDVDAHAPRLASSRWLSTGPGRAAPMRYPAGR